MATKRVIKAIENRARTADMRSTIQPLTVCSARVVGYIQGATEQHDIDVEKACKWLEEEFSTSLPADIFYSWGQHTAEEFKRAMEE